MKLTINNLEINISETNIHLHNSFTIHSKKEKEFILNEIIKLFPQILKYRTFRSMLREGRAHNILYKLNILRDRTKHTDLEFNQKKSYALAYFLINIASFLD